MAHPSLAAQPTRIPIWSGKDTSRNDQDDPRQSADCGLRPCRLHGRDLCDARHAGAATRRRPSARRADDDHDRRRKLPGLRRDDPRPVADGSDEGAGRTRRHEVRRRRHRRSRPEGAPLPPERRQRHDLHLRRIDHRDRCASPLAGPAVRRSIQRPRRFGLRHLRRLLLSRQGSGHRRRRQHRRRRSVVPHELRQHGHTRSPPQFACARRRCCSSACSITRKSKSSGIRPSTASKAPAIRNRSRTSS